MVRFTISLIIVVSMFAQFSNAEIDPQSIVGAWLFDETNGKVAKDASGNDNDGNLVGGAKWVKGKFGNAIELNGKDAWVTVPEIGPLEDFTLIKWFNSTGRVGAWRCFLTVTVGQLGMSIINSDRIIRWRWRFTPTTLFGTRVGPIQTLQQIKVS